MKLLLYLNLILLLLLVSAEVQTETISTTLLCGSYLPPNDPETVIDEDERQKYSLCNKVAGKENNLINQSTRFPASSSQTQTFNRSLGPTESSKELNFSEILRSIYFATVSKGSSDTNYSSFSIYVMTSTKISFSSLISTKTVTNETPVLGSLPSTFQLDGNRTFFDYSTSSENGAVSLNFPKALFNIKEKKNFMFFDLCPYIFLSLVLFFVFL
ncbi:uncharacterized protein ASCRUDRAFT_15170 [Ascoidea rubescens DSM 1968]|uniref:Uncharacterized protein n=1 Tax=Ascoidea rubescens DSM 1968 TaxID=1344418 RepID=A0A1D2VBS9_9ASCO|nr:hypothetical protein ASCRUDRAFT_15170 [Ascoidea rubescens DSM 1968]ODV59065.1 hypothetical protein ASCRUDRAFT_15170 [Ascoidea rubescens DSM 1968]